MYKNKYLKYKKKYNTLKNQIGGVVKIPLCDFLTVVSERDYKNYSQYDYDYFNPDLGRHATSTNTKKSKYLIENYRCIPIISENYDNNIELKYCKNNKMYLFPKIVKKSNSKTFLTDGFVYGKIGINRNYCGISDSLFTYSKPKYNDIYFVNVIKIESKFKLSQDNENKKFFLYFSGEKNNTDLLKKVVDECYTGVGKSIAKSLYIIGMSESKNDLGSEYSKRIQIIYYNIIVHVIDGVSTNLIICIGEYPDSEKNKYAILFIFKDGQLFQDDAYKTLFNNDN